MSKHEFQATVERITICSRTHIPAVAVALDIDKGLLSVDEFDKHTSRRKTQEAFAHHLWYAIKHPKSNKALVEALRSVVRLYKRGAHIALVTSTPTSTSHGVRLRNFILWAAKARRK